MTDADPDPVPQPDSGPEPGQPPTDGAEPRESEVVRRFFAVLADSDIDAAVALVADDLVYENVSLPTIRGKQRFAKGAERMRERGIRFDVRIHRMTQTGNSVMTERTDALMWGKFRAQFWVCGAFEVNDAGEITLWRDYFDWADILSANARGLLGMLLPSIQKTFDD